MILIGNIKQCTEAINAFALAETFYSIEEMTEEEKKNDKFNIIFEKAVKLGNIKDSIESYEEKMFNPNGISFAKGFIEGATSQEAQAYWREQFSIL